MSNPKKKTPLQEAIEQTKQQVSKLIEASERFYVNTDVAQQQLRVVITNLELLLPKEKEFAKEMWDAGKNSGYDNTHYDKDGESLELDFSMVNIEWDKHFKQYEP